MRPLGAVGRLLAAVLAGVGHAATEYVPPVAPKQDPARQ